MDRVNYIYNYAKHHTTVVNYTKHYIYITSTITLNITFTMNYIHTTHKHHTTVINYTYNYTKHYIYITSTITLHITSSKIYKGSSGCWLEYQRPYLFCGPSNLHCIAHEHIIQVLSLVFFCIYIYLPSLTVIYVKLMGKITFS